VRELATAIQSPLPSGGRARGAWRRCEDDSLRKSNREMEAEMLRHLDLYRRKCAHE
jgi:hypothetical protein